MRKMPNAENSHEVANSTIKMLHRRFTLIIATLLSKHTTQSFSKELLWTVEGQLQFRLGNSVAKTTAIDGVEYRWPTLPSVVEIGVGYKPDATYGAVNMNIRQMFLDQICQFVKCEDTAVYCSEPIQPRGHCCPICGRKVEFQMTGVSVDRVNEVIEELYKDEDSKDIGITFIKITEDLVLPFYQLAIISEHPSTFDSDNFEYFERKFFQRIRHIQYTNDGVSLSHMKSDYSTQHNKITAGSVFFAFFVVVILVSMTLLGTYGVREYETNPSFRLWLGSYRGRTHEFASVFIRGTGDGEDTVELIHSSTNPNFEESQEFVNEGYDPVQMDAVEVAPEEEKPGCSGVQRERDEDKLIDIEF
uniref:Protein amnionless n=1 Tax=Steinernema glaseri TaxID=37863 RepID=A0A1I8A9Y1_9BILA